MQAQVKASKSPYFLVGIEEAARAQVVSGGESNRIGEDGKKHRNESRDGLNAGFVAAETSVFDPQIHPTTHGRGYDSDQDGAAEQLARKKANLHIYEIGDGTQAVVTMMEVLDSATDTFGFWPFRRRKQIILWLTGATDDKGNPVFAPECVDLNNGNVDDQGNPVHPLTPGNKAGLEAWVSDGTRGRRALSDFITRKRDKYWNVHVVRSEAELTRTIRMLGYRI